MCIMEVRPGQHSLTIVQACTHNLNTVLGDLDMFRKLALARNEPDMVRVIDEMQAHTKIGYAAGLDLFGEKLAQDHQDGKGHWDMPTDSPHGLERTFSEVVNRATGLAHPYETR
jgi:hypothetical protein